MEWIPSPEQFWPLAEEQQASVKGSNCVVSLLTFSLCGGPDRQLLFLLVFPGATLFIAEVA